ncbi:hypothetical protein SAMN05421821_10781 [Mucilaginibacter lappiensis]|nr:hypothetical protein SAMN05421821_10781 [Mucilaginibacter lappiensis]
MGLKGRGYYNISALLNFLENEESSLSVNKCFFDNFKDVY